jgi:outer membrane protein insertion porin family
VGRPRRLRLYAIALGLVAGLWLGAPARASAQQEGPPVDSLVVEGNRRVSAEQIIQSSGFVLYQPINYRTVQRAIQGLFNTGNFDDVQVEQRGGEEKLIIAIIVKERPILQRWTIRGAEQVSEGTVRGKVVLVEGRPIDRAAAEKARAAIDSLYQKKGFYAAKVKINEVAASPGSVRIIYDITEGSRVAIAQVIVDGNVGFPNDEEVVKGMASKPEGFFWFQKGEYSEDKVDEDVRDRLPKWYGDRGYIDFQVVADSLVSDSVPGKAILKLTVDEGDQYYVGTFEVTGNRRYSTEEVSSFFPFGKQVVAGRGDTINVPFSKGDWEAATGKLKDLYDNTGYIYSRVEPELIRRTSRDGRSWIDLRWNIVEGSPATINRILILGNDVTHERVIREQITMVPDRCSTRKRWSGRTRTSPT